MQCLRPSFDQLNQLSLQKSDLPVPILLKNLLVLFNLDLVEGFFSNISLSTSSSWYIKLTPFESIFLALVVIHVMILRYLQIFPLNLNNIIDGTFPTRKRRNLLNQGILPARNLYDEDQCDRASSPLLSLISRLDEYNCLPLILCHMSSSLTRRNTRGYRFGYKMNERSPNTSPLKFTQASITILERIFTSFSCSDNPRTNVANNPYVAALQIGKTYRGNSSMCIFKYESCYTSQNDFVDDLSKLNTLDGFMFI